MNPRSESLLWIQLLGLAALPLEVLLLLVLFAGADPGPVPGLERLLSWGLGALGPAVLLWRRPADIWSLLLVQVPLRGRRPIQQRLSALQDGLAQKLLGAGGAALLLPLTWWADAYAGLATGMSPFASSSRLVVLLLSVPVLALMLWQWHQIVQAARLLFLDEATVAATPPLTVSQLEESRLCLGLQLLLLDPLRLKAAPSPTTGAVAATATAPDPSNLPSTLPIDSDGPRESTNEGSPEEAVVHSEPLNEAEADALTREASAPSRDGESSFDSNEARTVEAPPVSDDSPLAPSSEAREAIEPAAAPEPPHPSDLGVDDPEI